jgi:CRISPR system Cascade subunit CasB
MNENFEKDRLVGFLLSLKPDQDRGILAALRSGLGKSPGEAPRMYPYVAKYLTGSDPGLPSVVAAFLVASLFGSHQKSEPGRSLGVALWFSTIRDENPNGKHGATGVESRFAAMVNAAPDDLPHHLEAVFSLCESADQGLDWYTFHRDVRDLLGDSQQIREGVFLRWARDFWKGKPQSTTSSETQELE